jgi:hypothetical protein
MRPLMNGLEDNAKRSTLSSSPFVLKTCCREECP